MALEPGANHPLNPGHTPPIQNDPLPKTNVLIKVKSGDSRSLFRKVKKSPLTPTRGISILI